MAGDVDEGLEDETTIEHWFGSHDSKRVGIGPQVTLSEETRELMTVGRGLDPSIDREALDLAGLTATAIISDAQNAGQPDADTATIEAAALPDPEAPTVKAVVGDEPCNVTLRILPSEVTMAMIATDSSDAKADLALLDALRGRLRDAHALMPTGARLAYERIRMRGYKGGRLRHTHPSWF